MTEAEKRHVQGVHAFPTNFDSFLDGMQKSQKMHGGDRVQVPCQEVGGTGGPAANVSHKRNAVVDLTGDEEEEEEMGLRKKRQRVNNGGKATADPDEDSECAVCMLAKNQFVLCPAGMFACAQRVQTLLQKVRGNVRFVEFSARRLSRPSISIHTQVMVISVVLQTMRGDGERDLLDAR